MNNKIAIITSVLGVLECLQTPNTVFKNADYYAFVDREYPDVKGWNIINNTPFSSDPRFTSRRNAKIYKILPELFLKDYEYYIWIDASHGVLMDPQEIIDIYLKENDFAVFPHRTRNCVYSEINTLIKLNYDYQNILKNQKQLYTDMEYPKENGLFELPAFIKKSTPRSLGVSLTWWEYVCKYSSRDQISLPVSLWHHNTWADIIPFSVNGKQCANNNIIRMTFKHRRNPKGKLK